MVIHVPASERIGPMSQALRGRLRPSSEAPELGETSEEPARFPKVVIEHILSGTLPAPVDYDESHDEWVLVLEGGAVLEIAEERFDLSRGDWILLPAGTPHRLVETRPGTSWLAVHCHP
jgi:mannose-6-phosphate isomerase-like protein (cupin superfamily)